MAINHYEFDRMKLWLRCLERAGHEDAAAGQRVGADVSAVEAAYSGQLLMEAAASIINAQQANSSGKDLIGWDVRRCRFRQYSSGEGARRLTAVLRAWQAGQNASGRTHFEYRQELSILAAVATHAFAPVSQLDAAEDVTAAPLRSANAVLSGLVGGCNGKLEAAAAERTELYSRLRGAASLLSAMCEAFLAPCLLPANDPDADVSPIPGSALPVGRLAEARRASAFNQVLAWLDPPLARALSIAGVYPELYASPALATLFADFAPLDSVMGIWDDLLTVLPARDARLPVFIAAAALTQLRGEILQALSFGQQNVTFDQAPVLLVLQSRFKGGDLDWLAARRLGSSAWSRSPHTLGIVDAAQTTVPNIIMSTDLQRQRNVIASFDGITGLGLVDEGATSSIVKHVLNAAVVTQKSIDATDWDYDGHRSTVTGELTLLGVRSMRLPLTLQSERTHDLVHSLLLPLAVRIYTDVHRLQLQDSSTPLDINHVSEDCGRLPLLEGILDDEFVANKSNTLPSERLRCASLWRVAFSSLLPVLNLEELVCSILHSQCKIAADLLHSIPPRNSPMTPADLADFITPSHAVSTHVQIYDMTDVGELVHGLACFRERLQRGVVAHLMHAILIASAATGCPLACLATLCSSLETQARDSEQISTAFGSEHAGLQIKRVANQVVSRCIGVRHSPCVHIIGPECAEWARTRTLGLLDDIHRTCGSKTGIGIAVELSTQMAQAMADSSTQTAQKCSAVLAAIGPPSSCTAQLAAISAGVQMEVASACVLPTHLFPSGKAVGSWCPEAFIPAIEVSAESPAADQRWLCSMSRGELLAWLGLKPATTLPLRSGDSRKVHIALFAGYIDSPTHGLTWSQVWAVRQLLWREGVSIPSVLAVEHPPLLFDGMNGRVKIVATDKLHAAGVPHGITYGSNSSTVFIHGCLSACAAEGLCAGSTHRMDAMKSSHSGSDEPDRIPKLVGTGRINLLQR